MGRRHDLHKIFKDLSGENGNVYYQPPGNQILKYPCIIYKLDDIPVIYADDIPYYLSHQYQILVIDRDPDSQLREKVASLPGCKMSRSYESENLHHFVFSIHY